MLKARVIIILMFVLIAAFPVGSVFWEPLTDGSKSSDYFVCLCSKATVLVPAGWARVKTQNECRVWIEDVEYAFSPSKRRMSGTPIADVIINTGSNEEYLTEIYNKYFVDPDIAAQRYYDEELLRFFTPEELSGFKAEHRQINGVRVFSVIYATTPDPAKDEPSRFKQVTYYYTPHIYLKILATCRNIADKDKYLPVFERIMNSVNITGAD